MRAAQILQEVLVQRGLPALTGSELETLNDPSAGAELIRALEARHGGLIDRSAAAEEGPFPEEEEARRQAELLSLRHDAVCIEEMATDGRSRDTNEYYVIAYDGPDAAQLAGSHPQVIGLWLAGSESE